MSWVSIDGALVPREKATVSVYDRGFLYGDSIFETLRTYGGELFRLADHMARLARSAAATRIPLPLSADELGVELVSASREALRAAQAELPLEAAPELTVRVMVTRGESALGLLPSAGLSPKRVTFIERFRAPDASLYEKGAKVLLVPTYRPSDAARGAKVGNYLESLLCLMRAREAGADEALIVDAGGNVVEGTTSNLFVVRRGALVTPPIDAGLLPGITRAVALELAAELGIAVAERSLAPSDLLDCDEAFLTSTLREIMPIASIDAVEGRQLLRPGPVTASLRERFEQACRVRR